MSKTTPSSSKKRSTRDITITSEFLDSYSLFVNRNTRALFGYITNEINCPVPKEILRDIVPKPIFKTEFERASQAFENLYNSDRRFFDSVPKFTIVYLITMIGMMGITSKDNSDRFLNILIDFIVNFNRSLSEELLDIWDEKLIEYAEKICEYRKEFIKKIQEKIIKIHKEITDNREELKIVYHTDCEDKETYRKLLKERRKLDIIKGYTTKGIHRDDFTISINDKDLGTYGSQGQHRTAILSLRMAELDIIFDEIGEYPILLLDDFMSELDEKRRKHLLEKIENIQVIITCTDKIKLENKNILIYNVKDGKVIKENQEV